MIKEPVNNNITLSLNSISKNPYFKKSSLYDSFRNSPLGFIDAGARGGIHPSIMPVASLVNCTCFEPDENTCRSLIQRYTKENPFSKINIFNVALGSKKADRKLYVTKSEVNTSLLKPEDELITRYNMSGFKLHKVTSVKTQSLDRLILGKRNRGERLGEFIKLDCQGAEYDILLGAERILEEHCVVL